MATVGVECPEAGDVAEGWQSGSEPVATVGVECPETGKVAEGWESGSEPVATVGVECPEGDWGGGAVGGVWFGATPIIGTVAPVAVGGAGGSGLGKPCGVFGNG